MQPVTLFLCGDVMTGRGIDQVLPHPSVPHLYEPYVHDAREYVLLAEEVSGPIPRPIDLAYPWGVAFDEWRRMAPDVKIINLETSITRNEDPWPAKGIHYRMHPENVGCLTAAGIHCCALANNHILDWGTRGLSETLTTLREAGISFAGAGNNRTEASAPAIVEPPGKGRVIVFSMGLVTSGIPEEWAASDNRPGVWLLEAPTPRIIDEIRLKVEAVKRSGEIVIVSIHWGPNWGYDIPSSHLRLAHGLIDEAHVDIVHGHSSHHPLAIEVYGGRLILYGCGDLITDYEGIHGQKAYRGDLGLMYFATVDASTGSLMSLRMTPTQIRRFRLSRAAPADAKWLMQTLRRESRRFGARLVWGEGRAPALRRRTITGRTP